MTAPHSRHKLNKKRLNTLHSHFSVPTDHTSVPYRLKPWPEHTVLPSVSRLQPPQPRQPDRGNGGEGGEVRVLGVIDRKDEYNYTPRVLLDRISRFRNLDSRLVQSLDVPPRLLRPLNHISGPRASTPPPGPASVRTSHVLLDAQALINHSRDQSLDRENRFLKRVRQNPLLMPDLWRVKPPEAPMGTFSATCLGQTLRQPLRELSTLQMAWEESKQRIRNGARINIHRPIGTLEKDLRLRNVPVRRPPDHLLVVSVPLLPPSPQDILSLCSLREGLQRLKDKRDKRVK